MAIVYKVQIIRLPSVNAPLEATVTYPAGSHAVTSIQDRVNAALAAAQAAGPNQYVSANAKVTNISHFTPPWEQTPQIWALWEDPGP